MRFSPLIFTCLIAQAQAQTTPMTAADAFAAGKSSGDQAAVKSAFDSVTSAKGSEIIPGYSASTPPQSSYWSPSALIGPVLSGGAAKIAECDGPASSDPKIKNHCEAVQALAKQPSLRPPNLITVSDPLIVKGDAITNNPEAIAGAITGIYSACTTKTVSLGKEKQTETCEDYATTGSATCEVGYEVKVDADHLFKCLDSVKVTANASCSVGRLITVDADANYQCTKAALEHQTLTCNKLVVVTATDRYKCSLNGTEFSSVSACSANCSTGGTGYYVFSRYVGSCPYYRFLLPSTGLGSPVCSFDAIDATASMFGQTRSQIIDQINAGGVIGNLNGGCNFAICYGSYPTTVNGTCSSISSFSYALDNQCTALEARAL